MTVNVPFVRSAIGGSIARDEQIREQLEMLAGEAGYWDFRNGARRDALHGITQYPAMMVPAMQGKLIDILCDALGPDIRMLDPFVGSGTTLVEAMRRGISFVGQDLNPLAILISRSKAGPFDIHGLRESIPEVYRTAMADRSKVRDIDFRNEAKWFPQAVADDLSRLRRAILRIPSQWIRRIHWVVLAETVRKTSNSRTSTFKMHLRSPDDLDSRTVNTLKEYLALANEVADRTASEVSRLTASGRLENGKPEKPTDIILGDSSKALPGADLFDLLVTSPPYGDGVTTVPYGQYSYLPLQWIDRSDIDPMVDDTYLSSTHEIDSRALGGSRRHALERAEETFSRSPTLQKYGSELAELPRDRLLKVASFFADLELTLDTTRARMRDGGYMVWTVGNRSVGGILQPLDKILIELLCHKKCTLVAKLERQIPSKRMAHRNSISQTMRQEQVLLLRVGD